MFCTILFYPAKYGVKSICRCLCTTSAPKAFVNILIFDKNYNLLDIAYDQITTAAYQEGATPVPHQLLTREYTAREADFAFVYVSNENATQVNVHFACPRASGDDITMTYTPTLA